jgi:hypothetical protein
MNIIKVLGTVNDVVSTDISNIRLILRVEKTELSLESNEFFEFVTLNIPTKRKLSFDVELENLKIGSMVGVTARIKGSAIYVEDIKVF